MTAWDGLAADPDHVVSGVRRPLRRVARSRMHNLKPKDRRPIVMLKPLDMVSCGPRQMRLTSAGCARLFLSTVRDRPKIWEGRAACSTCAIGAARAGRPVPPTQSSKSAWCFRCQRNADRVIRKRLCISCYNREREAVGSAASARVKAKRGIVFLAARLARHDLLVIGEGPAQAFTSPLVVNMREAIAIAASKTKAGLIGRPPVLWSDEVAA